jgi:hypothetical protein
MKAYLARIDWRRVGRTVVQVFGPIAILFLRDWGADGVVNIRTYIFGDSGFILAGTTALAVWMNLPSKDAGRVVYPAD